MEDEQYSFVEDEQYSFVEDEQYSFVEDEQYSFVEDVSDSSSTFSLSNTSICIPSDRVSVSRCVESSRSHLQFQKRYCSAENSSYSILAQQGSPRGFKFVRKVREIRGFDNLASREKRCSNWRYSKPSPQIDTYRGHINCHEKCSTNDNNSSSTGIIRNSPSLMKARAKKSANDNSCTLHPHKQPKAASCLPGCLHLPSVINNLRDSKMDKPVGSDAAHFRRNTENYVDHFSRQQTTRHFNEKQSCCNNCPENVYSIQTLSTLQQEYHYNSQDAALGSFQCREQFWADRQVDQALAKKTCGRPGYYSICKRASHRDVTSCHVVHTSGSLQKSADLLSNSRSNHNTYHYQSSPVETRVTFFGYL